MALRLARRILERQHGTLASDVLYALRQADEATLEDVAINAATDTIAQVRARLGMATP